MGYTKWEHWSFLARNDRGASRNVRYGVLAGKLFFAKEKLLMLWA